MRQVLTYRLSVLGVLICMAFAVAAQERVSVQRCGAAALEANLTADPAVRMARQQLEDFTEAFVSNHQRGNDSLIVIPVVVHVLYRTDAQHISDSQIQTQLDVLNEDFMRLNADTALTPDTFRLVAGNANIQFCRATLDPDSLPTSGITRTATTVENIGNTNRYYQTALGGRDAWPSDLYLNIWVCELAGVLGFAPQPGGPPESDGVVVGFEHFGTNGTVQPPYNQGRTCTHEVGHWLNLYHIWGDDAGACTGQDFVSDTPDQGGNYVGCPTHPQQSCGSWDMFMNYMDNTDDACMNMFSQGQCQRMRAAVYGARAGLLSSHGCNGDAWPSLIAWLSASETVITAGASIDFTDQSSGGPISWQWQFEGGQPASSFQTNPAGVLYADTGRFDVQLVVSDGVLWDTVLLHDFIRVREVQPCDTLAFPLAGTPSFYLAPIGGFVSGNNGYFDAAKADYFDGYAPYTTVAGANLHVERAVNISGNASTTVQLWDATGPNGSPGTLLAQKSVSYAALAQPIADSVPANVLFDTPVPVTGGFFVGVSLDTTNVDTLALYTNTDGDSNPGTAWERWSDGSWHPYSDGWALNVSNAIYPIVCDPEPDAVFDLTASENTLRLAPNPATNALRISWNNAAQTAALHIIDLRGRVVLTAASMANGAELPLTQLPAGVFVVRLDAGQHTMYKRLVVVR